IVMNVIGGQVKGQGLNAGGLMNMLLGQKSLLSAAMPAALSGLMSFASGGSESTSTERITTHTETTEHVRESDGGGGMGWLKWLLPLLLLAGAAWFFLGRCDGSCKAKDGVKTESKVDGHEGHNHAKGDHSGHDHGNKAAGAATTSGAAGSAGYSVDGAGNLVDADGNIIAKRGTFRVDDKGNVTGRKGESLGKIGGTTAGSTEAGKIKSTVGDAKSIHVDATGNLVDGKGKVLAKAGEFSEKDGYYVDKNGNKLGAILKKIGEAIGGAAEKTADFFSDTFGGMFKKKEAVGSTYTMSNIQFEDAGHKITNFSKNEVQGLAKALQSDTNAKIQVQAHTTDGGKDAKKISNLRAQVIHDMLVTLGVPDKQISHKGMGDSDAGKAAAEKVEIMIEK
ncbi:OmpA family protein, partial [Chitinophagales bacterium]|nr:OmpA family protein [Chitinophagales bacterium]